MELKNISRWLEITNQQYELLMVIKSLQLRNQQPTPKNIIEEYRRLHGNTISRPNLFNQINPLLKRNLIKKIERGTYVLESASISSLLKDRQKKERESLSSLESFTKNLDSELSQIASKPGKPIVEYISPTKFFSHIAQSISKANSWYADSPFPNVCYPYALARKISRTDFVDAQWDRSIREKTLESYYLTNIRIDFVYYRALKAFGKKSRAKKECEIALKRMEEITEAEDKIHMRYLDPLPGPHMYIFEYEKDNPQELFLSLRGSNVGTQEYIEFKDPYGGVRIISPDIASQAKETYMTSFKQAKTLKGAFKEKIIEEKKQELKKLTH
ncbi:MAG: hypothetical protein ABH851_08615 [Methanobacteriota archaeon]